MLSRDHSDALARPLRCSRATTQMLDRDHSDARSRPLGCSIATTQMLDRDHSDARSRPLECSGQILGLQPPYSPRMRRLGLGRPLLTVLRHEAGDAEEGHAMAAVEFFHIGRGQEDRAAEHGGSDEDLGVAVDIFEPEQEFLGIAAQQDHPIILKIENGRHILEAAAPEDDFPFEIAGEIEAGITVRDEHRGATGPGDLGRGGAAVGELPSAWRTENLADREWMEMDAELHLLQREEIDPGGRRSLEWGAGFAVILEQPLVIAFVGFLIVNHLQYRSRFDLAEIFRGPRLGVPVEFLEQDLAFTGVGGAIAFAWGQRLGPVLPALLGDFQQGLFGILQAINRVGNEELDASSGIVEPRLSTAGDAGCKKGKSIDQPGSLPAGQALAIDPGGFQHRLHRIERKSFFAVLPGGVQRPEASGGPKVQKASSPGQARHERSPGFRQQENQP